MLQIFTRLHAMEPANTDWLSDQGDAWNNLGKLALEQGQPDDAIASYRADNRIKTELAARDPASHEAQENLLISNAILGRTLALRGDADAALKTVADAVASGGKRDPKIPGSFVATVFDEARPPGGAPAP